MAHEADGGLPVVILLGGLGDGFDDDVVVLVGGQQRRAQHDVVELALILGQFFLDVVVFKAVHQVGGLYQQVADAVTHRPVQSLGEVVDHFTVPAGDVVDDDLGSEAPAHVIAGEGLLHGFLDGADGEATGIVEAGAEGYHQQLGGAHAVLIAGIIQAGVAGLVVLLVLFFRRLADGGLHVVNQQVLDGGQLAQALQHALHFITGSGEDAGPAFLVLQVGHVVVGMVPGDDHQGTQDDLGVAAGLHGLQHVIDAGLGFHGAHVVVGIALFGELCLHIGVDMVRIGLGAVAHEADGGLPVVILLGGFGDGLDDDVVVLVRGEDGITQGDNVELVGILGKLGLDVVVLKAIHQVGGLHIQLLDAVSHGPVQGLGEVVDRFVVPEGDVVDDDLGGEAPADAHFGEGLLHGGLDGADGETPGIIEAGAEGNHQDLLLPDAVLVAGVIQAGVAGIPGFVLLGLVHQHGLAGRVIVDVEVQSLAQLPELEIVVAADVVGGQVLAHFPVDHQGLHAGDGAGALVLAHLQLGAVGGGVGHAGGDDHHLGGLVVVHVELAVGAVQQLSQVAELEIVVAVDVVLVALHSFAVDGQLLDAAHRRRRQGGSGQAQHQHDGQQEREHGSSGGSFHVLLSSFPLVHLSPYA